MSTAVLLAEPEPGTRDFLKRHLANDGFEVVGVEPDEALDLAERVRPDLALLASVELCRRFREGEPGRSWDRDLPVIVLGEAAADAVDRVRAFAGGADDFLGRPFLYDELLARIRAVLRRAQPAEREQYVAGAIDVDRRTRRVSVRGERVALAGKEYELLVKLASDPTRVFTKEELLRDVWGFRSIARTRTVDSHASRLRRKLARPGAGPFVLNQWGVAHYGLNRRGCVGSVPTQCPNAPFLETELARERLSPYASLSSLVRRLRIPSSLCGPPPAIPLLAAVAVVSVIRDEVLAAAAETFVLVAHPVASLAS
jgi:DNA-binding response OmpR family regulator